MDPRDGAMETALHALRDGAMSFNAFERATRGEWQRIARTIHKRWPLPPAVGVEDIGQELLLAIVRRPGKNGKTLLEKWDPVRGILLSRFVTWNAFVWACRWVHSQRGAKKTKENKGVAGKAKSTFAIAASSMVRKGEEAPTFEATVPVAALQEQHRIVDEMVHGILGKLRSERDRVCVRAYLEAGGAVEDAAQLLARWSKTGIVRVPGVRGVKSARPAVEGAVRRMQWATGRVMASEARA